MPGYIPNKNTQVNNGYTTKSSNCQALCNITLLQTTLISDFVTITIIIIYWWCGVCRWSFIYTSTTRVSRYSGPSITLLITEELRTLPKLSDWRGRRCSTRRTATGPGSRTLLWFSRTEGPMTSRLRYIHQAMHPSRAHFGIDLPSLYTIM